ncbi:MAG: hypothetical protein LH481_11470, partial [Burkholderiales bacterium]|nr:hypothetical protein [Burkholderiales bacterium]
MITNTRYLFNTASPAKRQRTFGPVMVSLLMVALSGCAELQKLNAEKDQPVSSIAETKLQPAPALSGRTTSSVMSPLASSAQAVRTPNASPPTAQVSASEPPRATTRTYVGTGNFVNQNPSAPAAPARAEDFTANISPRQYSQILKYNRVEYNNVFLT